jgi:hypothetical protein
MQRRSARTSHGTYQPITMVSYVEGLRVSIKIQIEFAMTDVSFKSPTSYVPARARRGPVAPGPRERGVCTHGNRLWSCKPHYVRDLILWRRA